MRLRFWISVSIGCSCAAVAFAQPTTPPAQPAPTPPAQPAQPPGTERPPQQQPARPAPPAAPEAAPEPEAPGEPDEAAEPELEAEPEPEPEPEPEAPVAPPPAPDVTVPSPAEMEEKLTAELAPEPVPSEDWVAPAPVFTLHGYFRMRGELMDTFWLGRRSLADFQDDPTVPASALEGQGPDPFSRFRPIERRVVPGTGRAPTNLSCVDEDRLADGTCDVSTLQFANMRLRLSPQLNISEDVRVKMTFDVFDNLVAGEPPASFYGQGPGAESVFASTLVPPSGNGGLGDSIKARRAWAEVRNRDLGELRFGRMPMHWGMGMYYNSGDGIDEDLSTDLDRVLGITKIAGLYLSASYDFIAEGFIDPGVANRPIDQSQLDDVDQFTFSVAKLHSDEELSSALERGEMVLNGGVLFSIRNQDALFVPDIAAETADDDLSRLTEIEASTYTTDLWARFRYRGLRIEAEAVWVSGGMDNVGPSDIGRIEPQGGSYDINQFGYALEGELRLLDEKLALYLGHGLATGDSDVEGLSADSNAITQLGVDNDETISTFRFHPSYRVDLILWRNIMRQVTGAYYFRPGISYDFVRSDFGQLLGARLDFIWSRASAPVQTWGNDANLGVEIDVSLYFRSEDGPDLDDGFHAMLQYGVLFPMRGLAFRHEDTDLETAQTLRLLLGVGF